MYKQKHATITNVTLSFKDRKTSKIISISFWSAKETARSEMLRAGVGFAAVMKLLGHTDPGMTMRYVDVTLTDLQREFQLARSQPRHLAPQPKTSSVPLRTGRDGLIDSLLVAQNLMLVLRRSLPNGNAHARLDRLANRLTKILAEIRKLQIN